MFYDKINVVNDRLIEIQMIETQRDRNTDRQKARWVERQKEHINIVKYKHIDC